MRTGLAIVVVPLALGFASSCTKSDQTAAENTSTSSTQPLPRVDACDDELNVADQNVKASAPSAMSAVATEGTPAAAAAKIRQETAGLNELLDNFEKNCHLPECPDAFTPAVQWLRQFVAATAATATVLLGGQDDTQPRSDPYPQLHCP